MPGCNCSSSPSTLSPPAEAPDRRTRSSSPASADRGTSGSPPGEAPDRRTSHRCRARLRNRASTKMKKVRNFLTSLAGGGVLPAFMVVGGAGPLFRFEAVFHRAPLAVHDRRKRLVGAGFVRPSLFRFHTVLPCGTGADRASAATVTTFRRWCTRNLTKIAARRPLTRSFATAISARNASHIPRFSLSGCRRGA